MKRTACVLPLVIILCLSFGSGVWAQGTKEADLLVDKARIAIDELMLRPEEKTILEDLIKKSSGLVVIPGMLRAGFLVGGAYGKGIMVAHTGGKWTGPAFVYIGAGSLGLQIGVESVDLILVVFGRKTMESMLAAKFKLGVDAQVAAGPSGAQVAAATDIMLKGGIYSYSRAKGAFAGISLEGAGMGTEFDLNRAYYDSTVSPDKILYGDTKPPATANRLLEELGKIK